VAGLTIGLRVDPTVEQARATLVRGRLVHQLHGVIDRTGPTALRRCKRVLVPGGMGWLRGAVAWDLHVHIRRVLGVWTATPDYIEQLGAHKLGATPPLPAGPVRIGRLKRNAALLLPFHGTRVVGTAGVTPHLRAVAVDGRWTAYALGGSSCLSGAA
jgi:hypothetical protein